MAAIFDEQKFGYWRCDECGRTLSAVAVEGDPVLPSPWRELSNDDYVGVFHVCSDACEHGLRADLVRRRSPRG